VADAPAGSSETLAARLARLDADRQDADQRYNEALTALDRSIVRGPDELPHPPPSYDPSKLADANDAWQILPQGAPAIDGSLKGRLRGFIWRLVGPALQTQQRFNAALVDHLNRNVVAHQEAQKATTSVIEIQRQQIDALLALQTHLIQYLQTITLYVDTRDRAANGDIHVVNAGLNAITDDWLKRWESLAAREARFVDRTRAIDDVRATAALAQQTALALKREVERLIAGAGSIDGVSQAAGVPDLNAFKYLGFEEAFRGSQDDIRKQLATYVPLFEGQTDVLDIGCGRGEFLELLRAAGIPARGLDLNHEMVEESRRRGLDVAEGDALGYLTGLPDASLGGVFAAQVVEHLAPDYLSALLETAAHKLRPGGVIVLETINPACWLAFFESYIRDLSHVRPIHPETLQYMLRVSGLHDVRLTFSSPVADAEKLDAVPRPAGDLPFGFGHLVDAFNENVGKLNARLFTFQDYAAIGRR
jgi:SAM-dependent methyltransferase